jgi:hypothetical protein
MFSTCMFCHRPLGANQVIEHFPVGRRLAFDAERGRLWVVCRKCERWNLSPLEERWEAVEMCERLFRDTRVRVSTENVGLAKHPEGLEFVRIGRPMRPEFAAWRYGDQFGRRRKRALIYTGIGAAVVGGVVVGGAMVGASTLVSLRVLEMGSIWIRRQTRTKVRTDDGRVIKLNHSALRGTRLMPGDDERDFRLEVRRRKAFVWSQDTTESFEGAEAQRLLGQIIPALNRTGGTKRTVQDAVVEIERAGHPDDFLAAIVARAAGRFADPFFGERGGFGYIRKMPAPTKLALEMALHEEQERQALEGELWRLERAWKEAEEIAAISDSLLLPTGAEDFIEKHRGEAQPKSERIQTTSDGDGQ